MALVVIERSSEHLVGYFSGLLKLENRPISSQNQKLFIEK